MTVHDHGWRMAFVYTWKDGDDDYDDGHTWSLSHSILLENNYFKTWRVQLALVMFGAALTVRAFSLPHTSLSSSYILRHSPCYTDITRLCRRSVHRQDQNCSSSVCSASLNREPHYLAGSQVNSRSAKPSASKRYSFASIAMEIELGVIPNGNDERARSTEQVVPRCTGLDILRRQVDSMVLLVGDSEVYLEVEREVWK
jgi:hypothetical protein